MKTLSEILAGTPPGKILIYGIGNPGRQDDALGVRVVEALEEKALLATESNYQLTPEDSLLLKEKDLVIFVDATQDTQALVPYSLREIYPATEASFTSHSLSIGALLTLCERLYGRRPRAYALAIPAYSFEVNEELSPRARANLNETLAELLTCVEALHA